MSGVLFVDSLEWCLNQSEFSYGMAGGGGGGGTKDNWKPYQHDIEALELALRFLDRENEMVRREYWGRREY